MPRRARVEERGRLVQHERVRVGEHKPRQRDLLRLRRSERVAARADYGLHPCGERLRPLQGVDRDQCLFQLLVGRARPRQPEILGDRPDEHVLLLRDERNLLAQRVQREVDEADAADLDAPFPRRMDARQQAAEGRLPGARGPDDRYPLARLQVEVDPVEHVAVGDVRVAHVLGGQALVLGLVVGRRPVGRDAGDPHQAGERGRADLDLVEPGDEAVDRVGQLHDVEGDRRHLADRRMPGGDEPAAPRQRGRHRQHVRELRGREPDRAQAQRAPLRAKGLLEVLVDAPHTLLAQAERLDRAAALDCLADGAGERRVRRAFPEVRGRSTPQVPARPDVESRGTGDAGQRGQRVDQDGRDHGQDGRHRRDQRLRNRETDRAGKRIDVSGRARHEVARARALDGRERQGEHAAHEVLAQLGEDLLGEDERGATRKPGKDRLRDQERSQHEHELVDVSVRSSLPNRVDQATEQRRPGEAGGGRRGVEADDAQERPLVPGTEDPRLPPQLRPVGDRQQLAHRSIPRVTVSR